MPALATASSNRTRLTVQQEGIYPAGYGAAGAPVIAAGVASNVSELQITGETLKFDLKTTRSKILRADRGVSDIIPISASVTGGIDCEHQYQNADLLKRAALQGDWVSYGSAGLGKGAALTGFTVDATGLVLTWAAAQAVATDSPARLARGQFFRFIVPAALAGLTAAQVSYLQTRVFRVSPTIAPTDTVLTLDPATKFDAAANKWGAVTVANTAGLVISSSMATNGNTLTTFQVEVSALDVNVHRLFKGVAIDTYDLSFGSGDIVTEKFTVAGQTMVPAVASVLGANKPTAAPGYESANAVRGLVATYASTAAAEAVLVDASVSATAPIYIKSFKLNANNNLRAIEAAGVFGAAGVASGTFEVTGNIEMYFTSLDWYLRFLNSKAFCLAIPILDPDGNGYVYYLPRAKINESGFNAQGENQDLMLNFGYTALVGAKGSVDDGVTLRVYRVGA